MHEITRLEDGALPQALDIYQQSFPVREQMPLSWWIDFLVEKQRGGGSDRHLVTIVEGNEVEAFAYYEENEVADYLWYLATRADRRGGGTGTRLFQELARRAFDRGTCIILEVELPEEAARFSPEEEEWAHRRIAWYRRNGARLLGGIEYLQDVGWQPPHRMGLMVASAEELSPDKASAIALSLLPDEAHRVGPATLT